ncbi:hypothetical protein FPV67DRAFT_1486201, partial [Lyophyllum atratum]
MVAFLLIILLALPSTLFVTKLRHPRIDQFRSDFREWAIIRCVERLDSITDPMFQHPGVVRFFAERQWLQMPPALTSEPVTPSNTCARRRLFPNPWTCPFDQPPSHVITPPNTCARPTLFPDFQLCPFDQLEPPANIRIDIPAEVPPTLAVRLDLQRTLCCVIVLEFLVICLLVIKCLNKSNVGAESSPSVRRQEQIAQVHPAVPLDAALAGPTHQMIDPEFLDAQLAVEIAAPIDDDSDSTTLEDVVAQDNSIDRAMGTSVDEDDDFPSGQDTTDQRRTEDQQCSSELDREQPSAVTSWFLQTSGPSNVSLADPLREYDPSEVSSDENGYPGFYNTSNPFYANGITPTNDSGQLSRPRICPGVNSVLAAINTSEGLDRGSGSGGHACTEVSSGRSDHLTTVVSNRDLPETGELLQDESSSSSPAATFELEEAGDMQVSQAEVLAALLDFQLSSLLDEAGDVCTTDGRMSTSTSASSSSSEGNYPWQAHYVDPDSSTLHGHGSRLNPSTDGHISESSSPSSTRIAAAPTQGSPRHINTSQAEVQSASTLRPSDESGSHGFLYPRTHPSTRYHRDDYNFKKSLTRSFSWPLTANESIFNLLTDRDTSNSQSTHLVSTFSPTNESLVDSVRTNGLTVESVLQPSDSGSLSFLSPETPTELRHRRRAFNFDTSLTPSLSDFGSEGLSFHQEFPRSGENLGADANACTRTVEDVAIAPLASATDKADPLPTTPSAPTERRVVLRDMGNEGAESAGASGSGPSRSPTANESIVDLLTDGDISNLPSTQVVSTFAPTNESLVDSVRTNGLTVESALQPSDSGDLSFLVPETPTELRRRRRAFNFDPSLTPSPSHSDSEGSWFNQESPRSGENMGA